MTLWQLFIDNLLPVFLAAGAGYILAARFGIDPRPVAHVGFYIFAPCLVYQILIQSDASSIDVLRMVGFTLASLIGIALIAGLIARWWGLGRPLSAAMILVVLLPNAGNYGLAATLFAFGEKGLAHAALFFLASAIVSYSLGVLVASSGRAGLIAAAASLPKVPAIWAAVLALIVRASGSSLPLPMARTVEMLSEACIPTFLIVLGLQLRALDRRGPWGPVAVAVGLRLVGGLLVGALLAPLFGLEGVAQQAGTLQSAMPSAVITIILATEYDVQPSFVTSVVFLSTLLSPLTLTPLLFWLAG
ncbi:MAG: AEC family transporter [Acidobacteriota bacterium]|nr:MAG: AEC family transporter [Acidobacteriota bacterium]